MKRQIIDIVDILLNDEYFVHWLIDPDEECDLFWKSWALKDPIRSEAIDYIKAQLNQSDKMNFLSENERQQLWYQIHKSTNAKNINVVNSISRNRIGRVRKFLLSMASMLVIILITLAIYNYNKKAEIEASTLISSQYIETTTPDGSRLTFQLEDGTMVKLNNGSKLRYPRRFNEASRQVILEGEAFFEVTEDKDRPFTVITENITTKVLGTSFNIKSYDKTDEISVAVISGKVAVENDLNVTFLNPDEMLTYDKSEQKMSKSTFDKAEVLAWKEGILYLKDADINEIFNAIKKWYGVEILIRKEVEIKKDFTGEFKNQSLRSVLEGISFIYEFKYAIDDKKIIIN